LASQTHSFLALAANSPALYSPKYLVDDVKQLFTKQASRQAPNYWPDNPTPSLLQDLVRVQYNFGFINDDTVQWLCQRHLCSTPYVKSIIDFYSLLQAEFTGEYFIYLSGNITDEMSGAISCFEQLGALFQDDSTTKSTATGKVVLGSCIGLSDQGPAGIINGYPVTNLSDQHQLGKICTLIRQRKPLQEWPPELFSIQDNIRQSGPLLKHKIVAGEVLAEVLKRYPNAPPKIPSDFINTLEQSELRGRGGAGYNTASKWTACQQAEGPKVVICNADEGEPGTFKDRVLLTSYLDNLIEGMTICAYSIGAKEGYIYLRGEYVYLQPLIQQHIEQRRRNNLLGKCILGSTSFDFDVFLHIGAGAYICGEESALIESLEGKRGIPRIRPPYPVTHGYLGQPTVVNNVETFCCVTWIADHSPNEFIQLGSPENAGTKLHSVSGDCAKPGIYELPMGTPVQHLLTMCDAQDQLAGVQIGGPSSRYLTPDQFGLSMDYNQVSTGGSFMVFNQSRETLDIADNFTRFFQHESCGLCTSCRVGTTLLVNSLKEIRKSGEQLTELSPRTQEMHALATLINGTSHCGLGHSAGNPVLQHIPTPSPNNAGTEPPLIEPLFDVHDALSDVHESNQTLEREE